LILLERLFKEPSNAIIASQQSFLELINLAFQKYEINVDIIDLIFKCVTAFCNAGDEMKDQCIKQGLDVKITNFKNACKANSLMK